MEGTKSILEVPRESEKEPRRRGASEPLDKRNAAREAAMVEACKRHGPVSVIILGGAHELAAAGVQVIRVTTKSYPVE